MSEPAFLSPQEAASHLGLSVSTLAKFRLDGSGPSFHKLGGRVAYAMADLDAWARSRKFTRTSDYAERARA